MGDDLSFLALRRERSIAAAGRTSGGRTAGIATLGALSGAIAALALAAVAAALEFPCEPNGSRPALDNHVDSVQLVAGAGFAEGALDPALIDRAAAAWSTCPGIPAFARAARSLKPPITIDYERRRAPRELGREACGYFQGRSIRLFALKSDGRACPRDPERVVQEIEHELGHWLGLGDECLGSLDIMAPIDGRPHPIDGDCPLADALNRTALEAARGETPAVDDPALSPTLVCAAPPGSDPARGRREEDPDCATARRRG